MVHSNDFGVQLTSALTADLDGDGREEVLAAIAWESCTFWMGR